MVPSPLSFAEQWLQLEAHGCTNYTLKITGADLTDRLENMQKELDEVKGKLEEVHKERIAHDEKMWQSIRDLSGERLDELIIKAVTSATHNRASEEIEMRKRLGGMNSEQKRMWIMRWEG
jgi:hypothetical protein